MLAALVVALVTATIHGYRLSFAPDVFSDEALFLLVARNLASGKGLLDDTGVFFWHGPLYPMIGAGYVTLVGLVNTDVISAIYGLRWLNVLFSSMTGLLLFLLGRRFAGYFAGLIMAGMFLLDPFVLRTNRRGMLETLTMMLVLLSFHIFFRSGEHLTRGRQVACGVALGLAMLTKEIAAFELLVLLGFTLVSRRPLLGSVLRVAIVSAATYISYPLWAIMSGTFEKYLQFKLNGVTRLFNVKLTLFLSETRLPDTRPATGPPFLENLLVSVTQYASSYLVIALGAIATLGLLMWYRRRVEAQFLIVWITISYGLIGFAVLGTIGDQFFYYLIIPAIAVIGYSVGAISQSYKASTNKQSVPIDETGGSLRVADQPASFARASRGNILRQQGLRRSLARSELAWLATLLSLLLFTSLYNSYLWVSKYGVGVDNSYAKIFKFVRQHLPANTTIVAGSEVNNFLFGSDYNIRFDRDAESATKYEARYFIVSSKERWAGYNKMTPVFYDWIMEETTPLIEDQGDTFWRLGLYYRDLPEDSAPTATAESAPVTVQSDDRTPAMSLAP